MTRTEYAVAEDRALRVAEVALPGASTCKPAGARLEAWSRPPKPGRDQSPPRKEAPASGPAHDLSRVGE